ncbi:MAG TPA: hypothetical protein VGE26_04040 [Sphingobacteriaceae bacterium]
MKKLFSALLFASACFSGSSASAQFLQDIHGKPVFETRYTHVEGSPYLHADWTKGVVKLGNGQTFSDIDLKYDLVADELIFKNTDGSALNFVDPVSEFKLNGEPSMLFRNGFNAVDNHTSQSFYQVLNDGGVKLLKKTSKKITEIREYNSASSTKRFDLIETYYLARNNQPEKVRKDKKAILKALKDRTDKLESYIRSEKLNLKEEGDLTTLIHYYNSL